MKCQRALLLLLFLSLCVPAHAVGPMLVVRHTDGVGFVHRLDSIKRIMIVHDSSVVVAAGGTEAQRLSAMRKPMAALLSSRSSFRSVVSGRRAPQAPSPACAAGHRPGYHPVRLLASHGSDGGASDAILLPGGAPSGRVPSALVVLGRGGSESLCFDLAVGVDEWWSWNDMPTSRHDGQ